MITKKVVKSFFYYNFITTISFMLLSMPIIAVLELFVFNYTIKISLLQKVISFSISFLGGIRIYSKTREYLKSFFNIKKRGEKLKIVFDSGFGVIYHYLIMLLVYTLTFDFDYIKHFKVINSLLIFVILGYPILGFSNDLFLDYFNIRKSKRIEKIFLKSQNLKKLIIFGLIVVSLSILILLYLFKIVN